MLNFIMNVLAAGKNTVQQQKETIYTIKDQGGSTDMYRVFNGDFSKIDNYISIRYGSIVDKIKNNDGSRIYTLDNGNTLQLSDMYS